jgi:polar amino acid transport system substrate-binding protein
MTGRRSTAVPSCRGLGRAALGMAALVFVCSAAPRPTPTPARTLVGVYDAPPFAFRGPDGQWRGLTVDLWKDLAADLKVPFRLEEERPSVILERIVKGTLATSAGPFAVNLEREQALDFSHAYLNPGIGVAVRRSREGERWLTVVQALARPSALRIYAGVGILLAIAGTIVWALERRRNPLFPSRPLPTRCRSRSGAGCSPSSGWESASCWSRP